MMLRTIAAALFAATDLYTSSMQAQTRSPISQPNAQSFRPYKEDLDLLTNVKTLQCQFDSGFATAILQDGSRNTVPMASLFGSITYDNIDRRAGTAREISDEGGKDMVVLPTRRVLTFVELTVFGNPVFTSVFPTLFAGTPGVFVAVTSRHITPNTDTFAAPRVLGLAQYYGVCRVPLAQ